MAVTRGLFVRKDSTRGTTPVEARVALAGLLTPSGDLGVTPGVISGGAVTGKTSWAYTVAGGHFVTTRSATDGAVLLATDGATDTPTVSAAPATGSRWDLVWIRHRDIENADPDSEAVLGVTSGTSSGSPSKPYGSVPAGALVLAESQVSAGAANTADPLVTITPVAARVATRGGIIPVTSTTQQNLLTAAGTTTSPIYTELNGALYKSTGSGWAQVAGPAPYARFRVTTSISRAANQWNAIPLSTAADSSGEQPWSVGGFAVTVTQAGLYDMSACASLTGAPFAVRIQNNTTGGTLVQSSMGTTVSFSQSVGTRRRLAAGDQVLVQVYPTTTLATQIDGIATPCFLALSKVGD